MEDLGALLKSIGLDNAGIRRHLDIVAISPSVAATIDEMCFIGPFERGYEQACKGKPPKNILFVDESICPDTSNFTPRMINEIYSIGYELVKKLRTISASEFAQQTAKDYVLKQMLAYRQEGGETSGAVSNEDLTITEVVH